MQWNRVYTIDAMAGLRGLPEELVRTVVTSPPYFRQRDYGCSGQWGQEESPEEYVGHLVELFGELHRVLKNDGTVWMVLGDSYASTGRGGQGGRQRYGQGYGPAPGLHEGIKRKDLLGIPWTIALALRQQGWYLRQDIGHQKGSNRVWGKKNGPMKAAYTHGKQDGHGRRHEGFNERRALLQELPMVANRKSVWPSATAMSKEEHYASFPAAIPQLCIKAGSREGDVVVDPFAGTGTTLLQASILGRRYMGFDLNEKYVGIARRRLRKWRVSFTGNENPPRGALKAVAIYGSSGVSGLSLRLAGAATTLLLLGDGL